MATLWFVLCIVVSLFAMEPPADAINPHVQSSDGADIGLLALMGGTTALGTLHGRDLRRAQSWRVLLVPVYVLPVLGIFGLALAFNNWGY